MKKGELKLSPKTIGILNGALWGVVNESGGTGKNARLSGIDVCGKTGTSQVLGLPENEIARRAKRLAAFQKDHALFACYAPLKKSGNSSCCDFGKCRRRRCGCRSCSPKNIVCIF